MRRLAVCLAVVWACSCGYGHGPLPYWVQVSIANLSQAHAAGGEQVYADYLCGQLEAAYGGTNRGYTLTFDHCAPAGYSKTAMSELYWTWYVAIHKHRVTRLLAKIDQGGTIVNGPWKLNASQFADRWRPSRAPLA